jgi:ATP-dependent Clp protease protease subunit
MGLPKAMLEVLTPQFFQQRKVLLMDEVDGENQSRVTQTILALNLAGTEPITLIIDSTGGHVTAGRWIADAIRCSEAPVHGLVVGISYSMAFWILQNCHRRISYPHGRLMFHGYGAEGYRCDQPDFEEAVHNCAMWHAEDLAVIAQRTGQSLEQWQKWSIGERKFLAPEALSLGLIDEIVQPKPLPGLDTPKV